MNSLTRITLTLALAAGAANVAADSRDRENLQLCKSDIADALGAATRTRLYDIQHRRSGDRFRLKAYPDGRESQTLNCWVTDEGVVTLQTSDGVALRKSSYGEREQVTLSN